ncbi:hypothetical protein L901_17210 [Agrobacterium sp. D14]|nr:hypothetical protein L901_17210 [Agrobacterium sp. D14]
MGCSGVDMTNSWFNPPPAETSNRFQVVLKRDSRQQHRALEKAASHSYSEML